MKNQNSKILVAAAVSDKKIRVAKKGMTEIVQHDGKLAEIPNCLLRDHAGTLFTAFKTDERLRKVQPVNVREACSWFISASEIYPGWSGFIEEIFDHAIPYLPTKEWMQPDPTEGNYVIEQVWNILERAYKQGTTAEKREVEDIRRRLARH